MSDFVHEITKRIVAAEENLRQARESGDSYLENVRLGELESLRRLAAEHGVDTADGTDPSVVALPADQVAGPAR